MVEMTYCSRKMSPTGPFLGSGRLVYLKGPVERWVEEGKSTHVNRSHARSLPSAQAHSEER